MTNQASFLQALGWALLNSLWQLALLWVIYQLITGTARNTRASFRSNLATALLCGGFVWFLLTFFRAWGSPAGTEMLSSAFVNAGGNEQLNNWLQQTLPVASVVYLALLLLPLKHFIRNYRYVQAIRKYGITKIHVDWRMFVQTVAARMNIKKKVQVWVSEFVSSPVTVGFLKPVILVPLAAINNLSPQQLEAVLLHELAHIKRADYLVNLLLNFIQAILYFNPFAKAFIKIVEREREKSCDEMVLQFQYNSYEYASALLALERSNQQEQFLTLGAVSKKDLLHRVELIMGVQKKKAVSFPKLAGMLAGMLAVIALNALLLWSKPDGNSYAGVLQPVASVFNLPPDTELVAPVEIVEEQPSRLATLARAETPETPADGLPAPAPVLSPGFIQASIAQAVAPALKKYQEEQVERTLEESKKVLSSVQWKAVEKSIADVFTLQEKEELKASYEKALAKMDWNKWEYNLKMAYDKIDWDKINTELSQAVNQVRMDSIQVVYNKAISKLDQARVVLAENELPGIPDTDISIRDIERRKKEVQQALNELKNVRRKKVVHL